MRLERVITFRAPVVRQLQCCGAWQDVIAVNIGKCKRCVTAAKHTWGSVRTCWLLEHPLHLHTISMPWMMGCACQVHKQRLGS